MKNLTFIILTLGLTACVSSQASYQNISHGKDLEQVSLISFDRFFKQWVFNKKIQKIDLNIREINKDSLFTYFAKPKPGVLKPTWTFFKVYSDTLKQKFPNYQDFYGIDLKDYVWRELIPKADQDLWWTAKRLLKCQHQTNKPIDEYSLIDHKVILTTTWKIDCSELEPLKNKKYTASYNLLTKQFENEFPNQ